jgi:hypothetical protein
MDDQIKKMNWPWHVACMCERRSAYRIWVGKPETDHLEDIGLDMSKGKVHPIICHDGPEVVQSYSSTLSLTSVLDGGG